MNFYFDRITLWLKNGKQRNIDFMPNKVNVITGDSNTGKTAILEIIDYCFFASKPRISESVINENVAWYGMRFNINDKTFTIARKSLSKGKPSQEYYFSSIGEMPSIPVCNNDESKIKLVIETEFKIDSNVKIPYGGGMIRADSKISLRYFLLFNTISQDIITNSSVFFDKQDDERYREALPRIFDLAVGIESIENILKREKKTELEGDLDSLQRKLRYLAQKSKDFELEINEIIRRAKEYGLVKSDVESTDSLSIIKDIVFSPKYSQEANMVVAKLEKDKNILGRKIRNLERFNSEYSNYKRNLQNVQDSLSPIDYLERNYKEIIKTSIYDELINSLRAELQQIKESTKTKTPIDYQTSELYEEYMKRIQAIDSELDSMPLENTNFESNKEKFIFLGETKAKIELYGPQRSGKKITYEKEIKLLETKLASLVVEDTQDKKNMTIQLLEEVIKEYIKQVGTSLENYAEYMPIFDNKSKKLQLKKPRSVLIENVGSSSNHMFLHLFLFLGLHEVIQENGSPFVPTMLIIDQPSRPYYGDANRKKLMIEHSDESKVVAAFTLLNTFIESMTKNNNVFQIIVFEHIPASIWEDAGLKNIHLVEQFTNNNALIQLKDLELD